MEDYGKLIEDFQCGDINALEFLLAQKELAPVYVADMQEKGITPSVDLSLIHISEPTRP